MEIEDFNIGDYLPPLLDAYQNENPEMRKKLEQVRDDYVLYGSDYPSGSIFDSVRSVRTRGGSQSQSQGMRSALTGADKAHMMKYLQLKYTILFLQKSKFIGKYCFYGCWCLPKAANFDSIGSGNPVDNIA